MCENKFLSFIIIVFFVMMKYDGHKNTLYSACIQIGLTHRSAKFQHKQEIIMITLKMAYAQNFIIS
jgi:hypothetical protein